jgi:hypothetical protein
MDASVRSLAAVAVSGFDAVLGGGLVGMGVELLGSRSDSLARAAIAAGVTAGIALTRCLWISLWLESEGVTVTNYFRTRQLSWSEITAVGWDRFELPHASAPSVAFRLVDGETVVAQAAWGLRRRRRERLVQALQELGRRAGIPCYLAPGDIKFSTGHHVNEPLSEHPALPKVDQRVGIVRRHPRLGPVFAVAIFAGLVLFPLALRALFP